LNNKLFNSFFGGKKVAILGFAREGQSTYRAIRKVMPDFPLFICDRRLFNTIDFPERDKDQNIKCFFGEDYLKGIEGADLIIKTPGIPFKLIESEELRLRVVSQTEIFIKLFGQRVVGITGTKGKSTTTSLLYHIFKTAGRPALLAGNIGIPPFDLIDELKEETVVVFEISSHQLEHCRVSPHIAILLNIFQEHLDHYPTYKDYQLAKMNIVRWQGPDDVFIYNPFNEVISGLVNEFDIKSQRWLLGNSTESDKRVFCDKGSLVLSVSGKESRIRDVCKDHKLPGYHNLLNIAAASVAAYLQGVAPLQISRAVASFNGLPHRLEFVGFGRGISFYNDSISTIPESTIEALKTFPNTTTLLLGGFDRGVDYAELLNFLDESKVKNLIFFGAAGKRMFDEGKSLSGLKKKNCLLPDSFEQAFEMGVKNTPAAGIFLLSPAAASYDSFRNFEHRGDTFKELVRKFTG
jgi:UDP-N-acetylmuramoylalanine--D-glutamate ligase